MNLNEVRAVITGGASGLGFAVAELLIASGGKVTLLDIQDAQGQKAAQSLGAGGQIPTLRCQLREQRRCRHGRLRRNSWAA